MLSTSFLDHTAPSLCCSLHVSSGQCVISISHRQCVMSFSTITATHAKNIILQSNVLPKVRRDWWTDSLTFLNLVFAILWSFIGSLCHVLWTWMRASSTIVALGNTRLAFLEIQACDCIFIHTLNVCIRGNKFQCENVEHQMCHQPSSALQKIKHYLESWRPCMVTRLPLSWEAETYKQTQNNVISLMNAINIVFHSD